MTARDEKIIAGSLDASFALEDLKDAVEEEKRAVAKKKKAASELLRHGVGSRFVGAAIRVSHVTIGKWAREVDN